MRGTQFIRAKVKGINYVWIDQSGTASVTITDGIPLVSSRVTAGYAQGVAVATATNPQSQVGVANLPASGIGSSLTGSAATLAQASTTFTVGGTPAAGDVLTATFNSVHRPAARHGSDVRYQRNAQRDNGCLDHDGCHGVSGGVERRPVLRCAVHSWRRFSVAVLHGHLIRSGCDRHGQRACQSVPRNGWVNQRGWNGDRTVALLYLHFGNGRQHAHHDRNGQQWRRLDASPPPARRLTREPREPATRASSQPSLTGCTKGRSLTEKS